MAYCFYTAIILHIIKYFIDTILMPYLNLTLKADFSRDMKQIQL